MREREKKKPEPLICLCTHTKTTGALQWPDWRFHFKETAHRKTTTINNSRAGCLSRSLIDWSPATFYNQFGLQSFCCLLYLFYGRRHERRHFVRNANSRKFFPEKWQEQTHRDNIFRNAFQYIFLMKFPLFYFLRHIRSALWNMSLNVWENHFFPYKKGWCHWLNKNEWKRYFFNSNDKCPSIYLIAVRLCVCLSPLPKMFSFISFRLAHQIISRLICFFLLFVLSLFQLFVFRHISAKRRKKRCRECLFDPQSTHPPLISARIHVFSFYFTINKLTEKNIFLLFSSTFRHHLIYFSHTKKVVFVRRLLHWYVSRWVCRAIT